MENNLKEKICVPVVGKNLKIFLDNLSKTQKVSDWVELRVDFLEKISEKDLIIIKNNLRKKAIFTFRDNKQKNRIDLIKKAFQIGFDFVDIDLETIEKQKLVFSNKHKKHLIISYHDFIKTPNNFELKKIINRLQKHDPKVIKISTMIKNNQDNKRLFRLMVNLNIKQKKIIIGMGDIGKITRIIGPILGNMLTFASMGENITAPGQIDITILKQIYQLIE